jgi:glycosyltransferase involved in cell wall biosynthesis
MKLAIVYHVYKNSLTLQKSLENLFNQTDKNFEFILINDGASSRVAKILKEFKLSNFKNLTYFKYSQNLGHSLSFNQAIQNTTADYVMFVGSNFIPHKDFVKTINNILKTNQHVDGISFNVQKNNGSYQTFSKLNAKAKLMLGQSMRDKIFSTRLLREHKIVLNEHIYAPFTFIYQNLVQAQK